MTQSKKQHVLSLALATGEMLLIAGAETYRVEETIDRMCQSHQVESQCFVTPSVILLSGLIDQAPTTLMKRVQPQTIDLHRIDLVNSFARDFSEHRFPIEVAQQKLAELRSLATFSRLINLAGAGLAVGGFSVLFGAPWSQFPIGFIIGGLLQLFLGQIISLRLNFFIRNIVASFVVTGLVHLINQLIPLAINPMIIGAIMPLVPGVAITNSVRDTLTGDFLSGITRASEAIFIALGIAFGVGLALLLSAVWGLA